jgi:N-terminal acetyltransferase B complex catalytic subunit
MGKLWDTVSLYIRSKSDFPALSHTSRSESISKPFIIFQVMGKAEGNLNENWHGHVTALTVSPDYRRLKLAITLMKFLEDISEKYKFKLVETANSQFSIKFFQETLLLC